MRILVMVVVLIGVLSTGSSLLGQGPRFDHKDAKTVAAPLPVFPEDVRDRKYGDTVKVLVDVDEEGKVVGTLGYGPLAPCSSPNDPIVDTVRKAAVATALKTRFEPFIENGKPTLTRLSIEYRLRPIQATLPEEDRRIVNIGFANARARLMTGPEYPESARASRLRGGITVQILIGEDGNVISAAAVSGHPQFSAAGAKAACTAKFPPMTLESKPAKMLGFLGFNFIP